MTNVELRMKRTTALTLHSSFEPRTSNLNLPPPPAQVPRSARDDTEGERCSESCFSFAVAPLIPLPRHAQERDKLQTRRRMGSGGSRGLQNRCFGAEASKGWFDSDTPPPINSLRPETSVLG